MWPGRHLRIAIIAGALCSAAGGSSGGAGARKPLLLAEPRTLVFGSAEYKAAVPRSALIRHVLKTHVSYVIGYGIVQTAFYTCLPLLKEAGVMSHDQIARMLTAGTATYVLGKLLTAPMLDLVGPKSAFATTFLIGSVLCLSLAAGGGAAGLAGTLLWAAYKFVSAAAWPSQLQMLQFWASRADSVKAWSLYSTGSRTGAVAATVGVGLLMARSDNGWQLALAATGTASALIFLLCKFAVDETPSRLIANARIVGGAAAAARRPPPPPPPPSSPPPRADPFPQQRAAFARGLRNARTGAYKPFLRSRFGPPDVAAEEQAYLNEPVHLKPRTLLRIFVRRPNFWLALGAAFGYSPIRQFEALIPLYLREARGRTGAIETTSAATAYHLAYWLSAGLGNPTYAKLPQGYQLCMVLGLLAVHLANLIFMFVSERPGAAGLSPAAQVACMAVMGATIAVPATGVLNIFAMDMGKADGSAMLASLQDGAGAVGSVVFLRLYNRARAAHGWAGVLMLLACCSAWTLLCEGTLLFRDLLKFRSGYVVNPVRTRRSVPSSLLKESYPDPADALEGRRRGR